jgi:hypothetical protein
MPSSVGFIGLEYEIFLLEKKLVELKRSRNSYMRVCSLPPEILVQVFAWLQHIRCAPNHARPWKTYDPRWSRIMAVCKHFRDVALRAPTLWTIIDYENNSPQWKDLCIARSGDAALFLHAHSSGALKYFHRARSARVPADAEIASVLNAAPAPKLRTLKLRSYLEENDEDNDAAFALTSRFLGGHVTHLVSLILHGGRIFLYDAPPMPALRYLDIDRITLNAGMESLWLLLKATPALEDLSIVNICLGDEDWRPEVADAVVAIPTTEYIALSCLKHLTLVDAPAELSALMRMICTTGPLQTTDVIVKAPHDFDDSGGEESDEEDEEDEEALQLNINHILIFDRWMDTIPEHALSKVKGSASLNVPYTIQDGVTLRFTSEDWPGSSLIMTCDIDDAVQNRLLDCVEVLRLVYQVASLDDGQSRDVFNAPNIRNLHNLQGLELMHFNFTTEECASLKTCLHDRQGRIKYVNLIGCDIIGISELSSALKSEGLMPELVLTVMPYAY